ncbi:hypothetical protein L209DRAFT_421995 [Thermothelomyces heterothallicus CBS 203.75]
MAGVCLIFRHTLVATVKKKKKIESENSRGNKEAQFRTPPGLSLVWFWCNHSIRSHAHTQATHIHWCRLARRRLATLQSHFFAAKQAPDGTQDEFPVNEARPVDLSLPPPYSSARPHPSLPCVYGGSLPTPLAPPEERHVQCDSTAADPIHSRPSSQTRLFPSTLPCRTVPAAFTLSFVNTNTLHHRPHRHPGTRQP